MDVVLLQDVETLGLKGDVVSVARGYARNFLLPRRLAEPATPGRLEELRRHEELRARHEAQTNDQAREIAAVLEQTELRFDVKAGPTGSLFGSVTATDIAEELWRSRRVRVDRRKIELHEPIKRIGRYQVPVEVFVDVATEVRTLVVPEGGELPPEEEPAPPGPEEEPAPPEPEEEPAPPEPEEEPAPPEPEAEPAAPAPAGAAQAGVAEAAPETAIAEAEPEAAQPEGEGAPPEAEAAPAAVPEAEPATDAAPEPAPE